LQIKTRDSPEWAPTGFAASQGNDGAFTLLTQQ